MKKIFISGAVLTVIALISYFLIADDGGDFYRTCPTDPGSAMRGLS